MFSIFCILIQNIGQNCIFYCPAQCWLLHETARPILQVRSALDLSHIMFDTARFFNLNSTKIWLLITLVWFYKTGLVLENKILAFLDPLPTKFFLKNTLSCSNGPLHKPSARSAYSGASRAHSAFLA